MAALALGAGAAFAQPAEPGDEAAIAFLESVQREHYKRLGSAPKPPPDEKFVDEVLQRYFETPGREGISPADRARITEEYKAELRSPLRSRYEDILGYRIIARLDAELRKVIARSAANVDAWPVFGTLPTRRVNAMAFAVPGSKRTVIAFEDQIFNFANLFSKAVALATPVAGTENGRTSFSTDPARIADHLRNHPEAVRRFGEVLIAYVALGAPGAAPQYFAPEPHASLAITLVDSMEFFVLGHEYGHVIGRHLGRPRITSSASSEARIAELVRDWRDELEADAVGVQLSLGAMAKNGFDLAIGYAGADLFTSSMEVVERALSVLRSGREPTDADLEQRAVGSHPPWAMRRTRLRAAIVELFGERGQSAVKLGEFMQHLVDELWRATKPGLERLHRNGVRPHASWLDEGAAAAPAPAASAASAASGEGR